MDEVLFRIWHFLVSWWMVVVAWKMLLHSLGGALGARGRNGTRRATKVCKTLLNIRGKPEPRKA